MMDERDQAGGAGLRANRGPSRKAERLAREKAALRANLARRKAQGRDRAGDQQGNGAGAEPDPAEKQD